jgi:hypothetical protein
MPQKRARAPQLFRNLKRQDRLDPDDPDGAGRLRRRHDLDVVYSFTDSKLLPRLRFVGLDQYERLWSTPLADLDREPLDLRVPVADLLAVIGFCSPRCSTRRSASRTRSAPSSSIPSRCRSSSPGWSGSGC